MQSTTAKKKKPVLTELALSSAEDPSFMFFTEVINRNSVVEEESGDELAEGRGATETTKIAPPTRRPDRLCIFSSFQDNLHGSERVCSLLNTCGPIFGSHLLELELHAYHIPPTEVPAVVRSLAALLQMSQHSLQTLRLDHLRLPSELAAASVPTLVDALGSLQSLCEIKWDPLPACLWYSSPYQLLLLKALHQLPNLESVSFSLEPIPRLSVAGNDGDMSDEQQQESQGDPSCAAQQSENSLLSLLLQSLKLLRLSGGIWSTGSCGWWNQQGLGSNTCSLKLLDLSRGTFVGNHSSSYLVQALKTNTSLQTLDLTNVLFQDDHTSLPHSSWPLQFRESLVQALESHNTTLQAILESSHGLPLCSSSLPRRHPGTTLQTMVALNRSGVRQAGGMDKVASSRTTWSYLLHRTCTYSPTITYQLLCDNLPSLFVVETESSS